MGFQRPLERAPGPYHERLLFCSGSPMQAVPGGLDRSRILWCLHSFSNMSVDWCCDAKLSRFSADIFSPRRARELSPGFIFSSAPPPGRKTVRTFLNLTATTPVTDLEHFNKMILNDAGQKFVRGDLNQTLVHKIFQTALFQLHSDAQPPDGQAHSYTDQRLARNLFHNSEALRWKSST